MKTILLVLFSLTLLRVCAQTDSAYVTTKIENTIYTFDFKGSKHSLLSFIQEHQLEVINQNENRKNLDLELEVNQSEYQMLDKLLSGIGYSTSKRSHSESNAQRHKELQLELDFLKSKKADYQLLLSQLDQNAENYIILWNEQKLIEGKIFDKEMALLKIDRKENLYNVQIDLKDETTSPEYTEVSFVNMPGFEYSYLQIESPKAGVTADNYQGYFLKYLFTKGKSFATIGVYKNQNIQKTDSLAFSELFVLGFGQDFYSRHLGRGSRKFLNLYSGYSLGGIMASGKTSRQNYFYIAPSIGVELYKNKYLLIDSKVYYLAVLANKKTFRGLNYNLSFNFVF